jgi:hypothetical protein
MQNFCECSSPLLDVKRAPRKTKNLRRMQPHPALRSRKLQHAEALGLVEGGRVAHRRAPSPVIAVAVVAGAHVIPHANAVEIRPVLVPALCSGGAVAAVDEQPRNSNHCAPRQHDSVHMRKALYSAGVAVDERVCDAAVESGVEDVGGVQRSAGRGLDFKVIWRVIQTARSDE